MEGCADAPGVEAVYVSEVRRRRIISLAFAVLALIAAFASLFVTQLEDLGLSDVVDVLVAHLTGGDAPDPVYDMVVWDYNVPRALLGLIVGSSLAVGGAVMQSIMRNPLATPYTTGVSAGASMGAALYIYLGFSVVSMGGYMATVAVNAIVFAMIPTAAILLVSHTRHITPTTMVLAGIAMMYVFTAATSLMMLLADPEHVQEAYEWNVGSLGRASWSNIGFVIAGVVPCMLVLQLLSRQVNVMNSGNRSAHSMGVDVRLIRNLSLVVIAIMTAITVGVTGGIGFMGLVAPHLARMLVGSNIRCLLPCSAGIGALILIAADAASRIVIPEGIPVGVLTAVVGGPVFIAILVKGSRKVWFRSETLWILYE